VANLRNESDAYIHLRNARHRSRESRPKYVNVLTAARTYILSSSAQARCFEVARDVPARTKLREFWVGRTVGEQWICDEFAVADWRIAHLTGAVGSDAQSLKGPIHFVQSGFDGEHALVAEVGHDVKPTPSLRVIRRYRRAHSRFLIDWGAVVTLLVRLR